MRVFVSFAAAERPLAHSVALALEAEGDEVFFDHIDLPAGEEFHGRIRREIEATDLLVFLITPESVERGSYARAELEIFERKVRRPARRLLPVMVKPTLKASIPAYAKSVTILEPRGDLVAETLAAVARLRTRRRWPWVVGGLFALGGLLWWLSYSAASSPSDPDSLPGPAPMTWPPSVHLLEVEDGHSVTARLEDGQVLDDLSFGPRAYLWTGLDSEWVSGAHVFFGLKGPQPPRTKISFTVTPEPSAQVSIYGYQMNRREFLVPPVFNPGELVGRSAQLRADPGEARTLASLNALNNSYNVFVAVAGAYGATSGSFRLTVHVEEWK